MIRLWSVPEDWGRLFANSETKSMKCIGAYSQNLLARIMMVIFTVGLFVFVYFAMTVHLFEAVFEFRLKAPVSEVLHSPSLNLTFDFSDESTHAYSAYSAIYSLRNKSYESNHANTGLYYIAIICVFYLTLVRLAMFTFILICPVPICVHQMM